MIAHRVLALGVAALAAAGCAPQSQIPLATTYPISSQQKMQAAHHWEVLAEDVALKVRTALAGKEPRVVYVAPAPRQTAFNTAFREFLITNLVNHGLAVEECADAKACPIGDRTLSRDLSGALVLNFNSQVLHHGDRGYVRPEPGTYTVLTAGVLAATATGVHPDAWKAVGLGAAAALDAGAGHIVDETDTEVIINVSLADHNRYLTRLSGVYYINGHGAGHYLPPKEPTPTRTIQLVN